MSFDFIPRSHFYNKYISATLRTDSYSAACSKRYVLGCVHRQPYGGRNERTTLNLLKQSQGLAGGKQTRGRCRML